MVQEASRFSVGGVAVGRARAWRSIPALSGGLRAAARGGANRCARQNVSGSADLRTQERPHAGWRAWDFGWRGRLRSPAPGTRVGNPALPESLRTAMITEARRRRNRHQDFTKIPVRPRRRTGANGDAGPTAASAPAPPFENVRRYGNRTGPRPRTTPPARESAPGASLLRPEGR